MNDQPLNFCAFVMNTPSHIIHGLWRDPEGEQLRYNELELWVDLAKRLEAGGFDAAFFADVIGLYPDFRGGPEFHEELGLQIPSNDPMVIISALAAATENLGLAVTLGFAQSPPFQFARQMATLDHATRGRIAWNIVTGANPNGWRNLGWDGMPEHDTRYAIADEYLEVLYKLWEGSWDEDAPAAGPRLGLPRRPLEDPPDQPRRRALQVRGAVPGDALAAAHAAALPGRLLAGRPRLLRPPRRGPVHPEPLDRGRAQADHRDP